MIGLRFYTTAEKRELVAYWAYLVQRAQGLPGDVAADWTPARG